jgi:uncharacterized membrane protein YkvA (DUF1232 family)
VNQALATRPRRRGFSAVPFLGDLLALTRLLRDPAASWGPKVLSLLAILYVVSPVDALPEALAPAIGWLDDVGLILALRLFLDRRLQTYRYPLFEAPSAAPASVNVQVLNERSIPAR